MSTKAAESEGSRVWGYLLPILLGAPLLLFVVPLLRTLVVFGPLLLAYCLVLSVVARRSREGSSA